MGKSKDNPLLAHLQNTAFHDERCRLVLPGAGHRLHATYVCHPGDWHDVIPIISTSAMLRTAWFPDANVAIIDETAPIWNSLHLAGLGSTTGSTFFTSVVRRELEEWLDKPRHHEDRAELIRIALADETWARKFGVEDDSPILAAILGYMRLLGLRRYLAHPTGDGLTMLDTDPEKKCDTMNAISTRIGSRALRLAKKGRIDAEKKLKININDELHCLMVICHSLLTGRESVILTADEDFIEIFWKAQWFFDTHYHAYLAAKLVKTGNFGHPVRTLKNTHGYFRSPLTLYRRHTTHLLEVLPSIYRSVPVSVIYIAPDRMIHKVGFMFEREMLDMLEIRSETRGRCTDLFGEENIHVDLGPLQVGLDGLYLGIGHDAGNWVETNKTKTFLSLLDQVHAITCRERVAR